MHPKEDFRKAETKSRSLQYVKDYLLSLKISPEQLGHITSTSLESKKNSGNWLHAAVFLGKKDIYRIEQVSSEHGSTAWFRTLDEREQALDNYFYVAKEKPAVLSSFIGSDIPSMYVVHMKKTDQVKDFGDPKQVYIIIPDAVKPKKIKNNSEYSVESAIYVDIPEELQKELGIELKSTSVLIATKLKKSK